eukprot:m.32188 g.32188  ORF g.32188 m.32188 type:complete len:576 (+) comp8382_c0_seq2:146-1873(+)
MLLLLLTAQLAFTMNISGEISRQRRGIHENMSNGCFDGNIRVRVKDGLENFKSEVSASLLCWFIKGSKDIQIIDELEDQIKLDKDTVIPLVLKETLYAGHPLNFTDMVFLGDYRDGLKNEEYAKELDLLVSFSKAIINAADKVTSAQEITLECDGNGVTQNMFNKLLYKKGHFKKLEKLRIKKGCLNVVSLLWLENLEEITTELILEDLSYLTSLNDLKSIKKISKFRLRDLPRFEDGCVLQNVEIRFAKDSTLERVALNAPAFYWPQSLRSTLGTFSADNTPTTCYTTSTVSTTTSTGTITSKTNTITLTSTTITSTSVTKSSTSGTVTTTTTETTSTVTATTMTITLPEFTEFNSISSTPSQVTNTGQEATSSPLFTIYTDASSVVSSTSSDTTKETPLFTITTTTSTVNQGETQKSGSKKGSSNSTIVVSVVVTIVLVCLVLLLLAFLYKRKAQSQPNVSDIMTNPTFNHGADTIAKGSVHRKTNPMYTHDTSKSDTYSGYSTQQGGNVANVYSTPQKSDEDVYSGYAAPERNMYGGYEAPKSANREDVTYSGYSIPLNTVNEQYYAPAQNV